MQSQKSPKISRDTFDLRARTFSFSEILGDREIAGDYETSVTSVTYETSETSEMSEVTFLV